MIILVARERATKMTAATVVPNKGATDAFAARRTGAFIRELGYEFAAIAIKSGQEPAIQSLVEDVRRARGNVKTMVEQSPVGESASNGVVERAIQTVQGLLRTSKTALEEIWKGKIPDDHPVVPWMVEHAAVIMNKCEIGNDGKTAHERMKGNKGRLLGIEFGEGVLFRRKPVPGRMAKLSSLWEDGVYLGHRAASGESIIGTKEGVWSPENAGRIGGVPWRTSKEDKDADGPMLEGVVPMLPHGPRHEHEPAATEVVPKRLYMKKEDFDKFGYTPKCPGCLFLAAWGGGRQGHSEACRKRIELQLEGTERMEAAKKREFEFLEHVMESDEKETQENGEEEREGRG